jgi:hypothetical protein
MDARQQNSIGSRPAGYGRTRAALERAWLGFEENVLWRLADGFRAVLRPFGSLAWFLREKLIWPITDRFSGLGPRGRAAAAGGGVALAAGIGVAALALAASGGPGSPAPTASAPVAVVEAAPAPAPPVAKVTTPKATKPKGPPAPTLHGATPVFTPPKSDAKASTGKVGGLAPPPKTEATTKPTNAPAATAKIGATPAATATASKADARPASGAETATAAGGATQLDGPPAGPKAIKVARNFAGAFVVYETGGIDSRVRKAFGESATAQLSHSLLKRPPRQPANVKVPRAKVVNVVPGPSQGKVFTVSVSLLRVGVTSELRLEMEQRKHHGWQVTNVLG